MSKFIPVIGLEIHVELKTESKMFCGCSSYHFQKEPNSNVCPVCLGLPGALPYANKKAIEWTMMLGKALGCTIAKTSKFDRKHYFYPDLPKAYQISQYDMPLCVKGVVETSEGAVGITRVHLEEDTGKLKHKKIDGKKVTLIDFNRSGVALMEIVTEPDIRSAIHAKEFAQNLRRIVRYLDISDCDMEKGSMRLEANVSVARVEESKGVRAGKIPLPNYKVELKNINSFRYLEKAIDIEIKRHTVIIASGGTVAQETRGYDEVHDETFSQRSKEEAKDYRYFPEPDLPPMLFSDEQIKKISSAIPELPQEKEKRFAQEYQVPAQYLSILTSEKQKADEFEAILKLGKKDGLAYKDVVSFIVNKGIKIENSDHGKIIAMIKKTKKIRVSDENVVEKYILAAIEQNQQIVDDYKSGKQNALQALVGKTMEASHGQADPKIVLALLKKKLS